MRQRALLLVLPLLLAAPACAHVLSSGHITLTLASGGTTMMDRVDSIVWTNDSGAEYSNYIASGGAVNCGDPQEFFGQAYGDADGSPLVLVAQGAKAKWRSGDAFHGSSRTSGKDDCIALSGTTKTIYELFADKAHESMVKVVRTFKFGGSAKDQAFNLRAYAPRLRLSHYQTVLYPGTDGLLHRKSISQCPTACVLADWNGTWFADDAASFGDGMVVIRAKSSSAPATLDGDFDGFSSSNVSSIVLTRPANGWQGTVTETEYLCFYDTTNWPTPSVNNLPKGCKVK